MKYTLDYEKYAELARRVAAEGSVLLRNEDGVLPLQKGQRVSIFGRTQFEHYKSGTGSGGMVNAPYVTNITDSLKEDGTVQVNEVLEAQYREWLKDHPFDIGEGWAMEPWNQEEMPVSEELARQAAEQSDLALVVLGRTAGEDKDNSAAEGSYLLTAAEEEILRNVCNAFARTIVVLNVGNIMDMKWVDRYQPQAVLYVWQGGVRPVLIIQNDIGNRHSPTVICAAITSRMNKAKLPTHIEIEASAYGIVRDSVILLEQLRTIDKRRLKDKICHLTPEQLALVNEALKISLDLPT